MINWQNDLKIDIYKLFNTTKCLQISQIVYVNYNISYIIKII